MANTGLQNESLINELQISGSLAIKTKNASGIYPFQEKSMDDGVIFGKLNRPKYNQDELIKSIDTVIVELLPIEPPPVEDTVPRRVYNPVTQSVIDLTIEVSRLNSEVLDLQAKVTSLEIVTQSLRVEVDGQSIIAASAANTSEQTTTKIQSSVLELSNAIQKATSEAIQRVSLTARTQALEEQNKVYKEQIDGKTAKIQEGQKASGDITYKIVKRTLPDDKDLRVEVTSGLSVAWFNGPDIEIYNPTETSVTVEFKQDGDNTLKSISPITIESKATKIVTLEVDTAKAATKNPKSSGGIFGGLVGGKDNDYDSTLLMTNINKGSKRGEVAFTFRLYKKKK
jgi:hypothetical protein